MALETLALVGLGLYALSKSSNKRIAATVYDTVLNGDTDKMTATIGSNDSQIIELEIYNNVYLHSADWPWKHEFDPFIYTLCKMKYFDIDPIFIKAIMKQESNFNPKAIRQEPQIKDASIGLMQVLTQTAKMVAPFPDKTKDEITAYLFKPYLNICVGTKYFAGQVRRYNRNYEKAISAYNAGSAIISKTTHDFINRAYVDSVVRNTVLFQNHFPR